jgi:hypothetical protein
MQKEEIIERHLREHGLEMKDINTIIPFHESEEEIRHQRLTSYILSQSGIKRSRILSEYYYNTIVFLKEESIYFIRNFEE